jgi:hypothetical protein
MQIVHRHGARTPYDQFSCWKGYDIEWIDCNVTELMIPSPSSKAQNRPSPWLFRKLYDAGDNLLGGNCLTGQLLIEGYHQLESLGRILRAAYLQGPDADSLKLFPTSIWTELDQAEIYLRSDDETRTLMSGQVMVHTMFDISEEVIVDWHTEDYRLDQIYPNSFACPR